MSIVLLPLLGIACGSEPESAVSEIVEERRMRIVEVLASSAAPASESFIELRNDGEASVDLTGFALKFASTEARLVKRPVPGSAEQVLGVDASVVAPHGLALVVDAGMSDERVARIACEAPVQTTRQALGSAHAAENDVLATTLAIQAAPHCMPVFTIDGDGLGKRLMAVTDVSLMDRKTRRDRARGQWAKQPRGVALERRGVEPEAFAASPLGSTPGARNFWRSDVGLLNDADARPPIEPLVSSPWRVGDTVLALRREAAGKSGSEAQQLLDRAKALENGKELPHNPLIEPFDTLVAEATESAAGAFYQINDPVVVDALVKARTGRGVDVGIITDAEFKSDAHYTSGLEALRQAGVQLAFDEAGGNNRAPLMHNKFLAVDRRWVWTGSFNPIEDEPHRIHADNALVLESRALADLHEREHQLMMSGKFGVTKRGAGKGGMTAWIDGARNDVRFSPGLTADQLKRRGAEFAKTGDVRKACEVTIPSKRSQKVIEDRYRSLDPCGGPMDLILGEIARATSSVYFVAFSLALDHAADVMIERLKAGVDVKGVVDPTVATKGVPSAIRNAGADVRFTPNSDPACPEYVKPKTTCPKNPNKVWLHHKFVVVDYGTDHPVVITGSHNMSDSAELQNDETLVVIRDRAVAEAYYRFFREVYDHPQTLGARRDLTGLPTLAITEVRPSADPGGPQFVEIQNLGDEPASLGGLELWNRSTTVSLGNGVLQPGARAVVVAGGSVPVAPGATVITIPRGDEPLVSPSSALVIREANGGRWVATYDPYTSELSLPEGVTAAGPGEAWDWSSFDADVLDATMLELLGHNATPEAAVPTWQPRGFYSDWLDEHDVTPVGIVMMKAPLLPWTPAGQGTPGS